MDHSRQRKHDQARHRHDLAEHAKAEEIRLAIFDTRQGLRAWAEVTDLINKHWPTMKRRRVKTIVPMNRLRNKRKANKRKGKKGWQ
jgi:hypothetical protein